MVEVYDNAGNKTIANSDTSFLTKEWVVQIRRLCRVYT